MTRTAIRTPRRAPSAKVPEATAETATEATRSIFQSQRICLRDVTERARERAREQLHATARSAVALRSDEVARDDMAFAAAFSSVGRRVGLRSFSGPVVFGSSVAVE